VVDDHAVARPRDAAAEVRALPPREAEA